MILLSVTVPSKKTRFAYIAVINIDNLHNEDGVRVHPLRFDMGIVNDNGEAVLETRSFFEPTILRLSANEQVFLIYGPEGVCIGNIATLRENRRHKKTS
jgi:hypothetical protein